MTKWGNRPHWQMEAILLGSDEHGDWLGFRRGTTMSRPGREFVSVNDQVGLVPYRSGWMATFHGAGGEVRTYVDITTVPAWDGNVVRAVDLDLDVVERIDGSVHVDDEDEFADHRVRFGYPQRVVELATANRDLVVDALTSRAAPFDGTCERWLAVLAHLTRQPRNVKDD